MTETETGPPPHRRGARATGPCDPAVGRTTPASAGSTPGPDRKSERWADHPRIGGEHDPDGPWMDRRAGPPPHRRGAQDVPVLRQDRGRTTPASAGSTTPESPRNGRKTDHPRIGGEHHNLSESARDLHGPPPHRRGAHYRKWLVAEFVRTTPASAGSTPACARRASRRADHPRIGGEHTSRPALSQGLCNSFTSARLVSATLGMAGVYGATALSWRGPVSLVSCVRTHASGGATGPRPSRHSDANLAKLVLPWPHSAMLGANREGPQRCSGRSTGNARSTRTSG